MSFMKVCRDSAGGGGGSKGKKREGREGGRGEEGSTLHFLVLSSAVVCLLISSEV